VSPKGDGVATGGSVAKGGVVVMYSVVTVSGVVCRQQLRLEAGLLFVCSVF